ncbi:hypothetical protein CEXT_534591 [Caerostris extrusa]|uniref:Uncharacterized protein n=1 Tax=Caerostris extrusa TaxID=172846 RepID=A0AAV4PGC0_CAEEX|nr:hypothetical protein CEXT_534591 [Caerostris extrusa]
MECINIGTTWNGMNQHSNVVYINTRRWNVSTLTYMVECIDTRWQIYNIHIIRWNVSTLDGRCTTFILFGGMYQYSMVDVQHLKANVQRLKVECINIRSTWWNVTSTLIYRQHVNCIHFEGGFINIRTFWWNTLIHQHLKVNVSILKVEFINIRNFWWNASLHQHSKVDV